MHRIRSNRNLPIIIVKKIRRKKIALLFIKHLLHYVLIVRLLEVISNYV